MSRIKEKKITQVKYVILFLYVIFSKLLPISLHCCKCRSIENRYPLHFYFLSFFSLSYLYSILQFPPLSHLASINIRGAVAKCVCIFLHTYVCKYSYVHIEYICEQYIKRQNIKKKKSDEYLYHETRNPLATCVRVYIFCVLQSSNTSNFFTLHTQLIVHALNRKTPSYWIKWGCCLLYQGLSAKKTEATHAHFRSLITNNLYNLQNLIFSAHTGILWLRTTRQKWRI